VINFTSVVYLIVKAGSENTSNYRGDYQGMYSGVNGKNKVNIKMCNSLIKIKTIFFESTSMFI
jgi:hypothetical protein